MHFRAIGVVVVLCAAGCAQPPSKQSTGGMTDEAAGSRTQPGRATIAKADVAGPVPSTEMGENEVPSGGRSPTVSDITSDYPSGINPSSCDEPSMVCSQSGLPDGQLVPLEKNGHLFPGTIIINRDTFGTLNGPIDDQIYARSLKRSGSDNIVAVASDAPQGADFVSIVSLECDKHAYSIDSFSSSLIEPETGSVATADAKDSSLSASMPKVLGFFC